MQSTALRRSGARGLDHFRLRAALAELAQFPLFAAIMGRRSRQFPVGGRIPDGALAYISRRPVQPLSEIERALLISATGGVTGWHYGITHNPGYAPSLPNYSGSATGRTFPSAAGFRTSQLFFTDDTGTYLLPNRDEQLHELHTIEEWISHTAESYVRISDSRLELPQEEPYMEGHNVWIGNHPGNLDPDFYDKFFRPGAYLETHAKHQARWHGQ